MRCWPADDERMSEAVRAYEYAYGACACALFHRWGPFSVMLFVTRQAVPAKVHGGEGVSAAFFWIVKVYVIKVFLVHLLIAF